MLKTIMLLLVISTQVHADNIWQLSTNENPCSGMRIVGDNGNQEGYVIPAPEPYKEVIPENKMYINEPFIQEVNFDDVNVDENPAEKALPYNR